MPANEFDQPIGDPVDWSPRPVVVPVTLTGETCRLEPWDEQSYLQGLYDAVVRRSPASTWTYLRPPPPADPAALAEVMAALAADPDAVPLVICDPGGTALGTASFLRLDAANGSVDRKSVV